MTEPGPEPIGTSDEACATCQALTVHDVLDRTASSQTQRCQTCGTMSRRTWPLLPEQEQP